MERSHKPMETLFQTGQAFVLRRSGIWEHWICWCLFCLVCRSFLTSLFCSVTLWIIRTALGRSLPLLFCFCFLHSLPPLPAIFQCFSLYALRALWCSPPNIIFLAAKLSASSLPFFSGMEPRHFMLSFSAIFLIKKTMTQITRPEYLTLLVFGFNLQIQYPYYLDDRNFHKHPYACKVSCQLTCQLIPMACLEPAMTASRARFCTL